MQNDTSADKGDSGGGNHNPGSHRRSNKDLTEEEKQAKRKLKRQLKQLAKQKKLETRIRHAIDRRDPVVEAQARAELADLLLVVEQDEEHQQEVQPAVEGVETAFPSSTRRVVESELEIKCRFVIESTYYQLQLKLNAGEQKGDDKAVDDDDSSSSANTKKELRTEQAKKLLRNMTKATQELSMFDNEDALMGYTRHKFVERSMLVVSSLSKLVNNPPALLQLEDSSSITQQSAFRTRLLERLKDIKTVASIGCGPGCDAFGMAQLVSSLTEPTRTDSSTGTPPCRVERLVLLDWAMDQWGYIAKPLEELVVPKLVDSIDCGTCNVLKSLEDAENANALKLLISGRDDGESSSNADDDKRLLKVDIFITSYLLSETRGKWHEFFDTLFQRARPGSLFLFSDPTAWQLHIWLAKYSNHRDDFQQQQQELLEGYCWLDSSMNQPELQDLEGRLGPAVLVAMKKCT